MSGAAHRNIYSVNKVVMTTSSPHPLPSIGVALSVADKDKQAATLTANIGTLENLSRVGLKMWVWKVHCKSDVDITTDVLSN